MLNQLKGVFSSFQKHEVRYLVIGGIAAVLYGVPRATFDLDVLIEATPDNSRRLLDALIDAQLGTAELTTPEQILDHEITIFRDRVRIDVQTMTPGIAFAEAWSRKKTMTFQGQTFNVVSRDDLIASKLASGRPVDLEDVRLLRLSAE
ncbi:MAG TPA: nucleotidyltransferase [Promineifilum sp.]|nr:nucleotidyltransferase [Promineifilum sp.]HRQ14918.1 nucleotidyltransferase [Promineifilum sp.]